MVAEIFPQFFFLAVRRSKSSLDGYPGHDVLSGLSNIFLEVRRFRKRFLENGSIAHGEPEL
jgi:hypothetical protein